MTALVVFCHPLGDSFNAAAAAQVRKTLSNAWGEPLFLDLYKEGFDAVQASEHLLEEHRTMLAEASGLVFVYPTWWGSMPALLHGWLEQLLPKATGEGAAKAREMLTHLDYLLVVTSHGSTKFVNMLGGEPAKRFFRRSVHRLCPTRCAFRWMAFYNSDRSSDKQRRAFLRRVDRRIKRLLGIITGASQPH